MTENELLAGSLYRITNFEIKHGTIKSDIKDYIIKYYEDKDGETLHVTK